MVYARVYTGHFRVIVDWMQVVMLDGAQRVVAETNEAG